MRLSILLRAITIMMFTPLPCAGQGSYDLTGFWQDDVGGKYAIRQIDNRVGWIDDGRPTYIHVFQGTIYGDTLTGQWMDVPGGQIQNSGTLTVRIESNSRMVVLSSTASSYGSKVITRGDTTSTSNTPGCDISGTWRVNVQADWNETESVWTFTSLGGGRYSGTEKGMGNATGTATVNGSILRLEWNTLKRLFGEDVRENGVYEWRLDVACQYGNGTWRSITKNATANASIQRVQTCDVSGAWINTLDQGGEGNTSVWTFTSLGGNRYSAREQGLGNATGTAVIMGDALHLDYETPTRRLFGEDVKDVGFYDWKLNAACNIGDGKMSRGRASRIQRYSGDTGTGTGQYSNAICYNSRTLPLMEEWLSRAVPATGQGVSLQYDQWCRWVGYTPLNTFRGAGTPDLNGKTRCDYLWDVCRQKPSANGLGTMEEYVTRNER